MKKECKHKIIDKMVVCPDLIETRSDHKHVLHRKQISKDKILVSLKNNIIIAN